MKTPSFFVLDEDLKPSINSIFSLQALHCESMAPLVLLLLLLSPVALSARYPREETLGMVRSEHEMRWLYDEWALTHDKSYSSASEKEKRFEIFKNNLLFIDDHNRPENNNTYTVGLNKFADLTDEEFRDLYLGPPLNRSRTSAADVSTRHRPKKVLSLPESIEWILEKVVTSVKDQGECPSGRAFAAVAAIEGLNKIVKQKKLITFSEQELIDCDYRSYGCYPGDIADSYQYIIDNGGIDCDNHYPYTGFTGACKEDRRRVAILSGFRSVESEDPYALKVAVARQPVSVRVDASGRHFRFYKTGVFSGPCGTAGDHYMTVIGYGLDPKSRAPFWRLKNSWGLTWGSYGMMMIRRDTNKGSGVCGVHEYAHYPAMNRRVGKESE